MHNEKDRRSNRLLAIADDDQARLADLARAFETAGWQVVATPIDGCADIAAAGDPCALVISLTTDAALKLLLTLARQPGTSEIPVIVSAWDSEQIRARAEKAGSVAVFLERPSTATLIASVKAVLGLHEPASVAVGEFPAWCPQCSERTGVPRSVSTATEAGTYVGLECEPCGQRWRILRVTPPSRPLL